MVVRFVSVVRVPLCARVSRVFPVSFPAPRCLFTGTAVPHHSSSWLMAPMTSSVADSRRLSSNEAGQKASFCNMAAESSLAHHGASTNASHRLMALFGLTEAMVRQILEGPLLNAELPDPIVVWSRASKRGQRYVDESLEANLHHEALPPIDVPCSPAAALRLGCGPTPCKTTSW